ncbi:MULTISPECIES: hypothetical protein [unclassified Crossiella]|uniref:hypothetical protein n=1 Tax=unclassified Crossiella TaxID=2620835 RepID=UPI001FFF7407|nr:MULTISPECIES: hypothetical protein [unclassified Crossiella]MCK2241354.1 hypothetical protein [Crossiella sp. S99.2]MCK2253502.1 hypothetical protein [Crossiella sp. S99.1]
MDRLVITGCDSVFIAEGSAPRALARFLQEFSSEWPDMLAATDMETFVPWRDAVGVLSADVGDMLVARSQEMAETWLEDGYFLAEHGGPFAIYYEPLRREKLKITALDDPYIRAGFGFEPYDLTLCSRSLSLFTLVSPDVDSEFSIKLANMFSSVLSRRADG